MPKKDNKTNALLIIALMYKLYPIKSDLYIDSKLEQAQLVKQGLTKKASDLVKEFNYKQKRKNAQSKAANTKPARTITKVSRLPSFCIVRC